MNEDINVIDIEADGLEATKIWCLAVHNSQGSKATSNYDNMRKFFSKAKILVCHNLHLYDIPTVERILGIKVNALLVDTLALSWYLYPERIKHGLAEWGEEFGVPKPVINDWENLTVEEYIHRCQEDVKINRLLWEKMWNYLKEIYDNEEDIWKLIRYLSEKMDCAREQERSKWKLDVDKCRTELESLQAIQAETLTKLASAMPKVKKYATKSRPAKPFKKDGTYSATGARWFALVRREHPEFSEWEVETFLGTIEEFHHEEEPNPKSSVQVKDWLYSFGWKPITFKYQRDKETGDIREIPQINLEHGAGICPSVQHLYSIEPNLQHLEGLGVVSHRISILSGFVDNVDDNGYVRARIAGLTNTLRFKHKEIVNLPKVGKPYGDIIRGVLIAPEGHELCGSDMSSLEDRLKQSFLYDYDPEYVESLNTEGYDPHLDIAITAGMMTKEEAEFYKWYASQH